MQAVTESCSKQAAADKHLRFCILSPDTRHHSTALFLGNNVCQRLGSYQEITDNLGNPVGKQGRHCIANLQVLLGPVPGEKVVIWKCLKTGSFAHCQTSALMGVRMNIVVTVFRYVAGNCRGRTSIRLNAEPIIKMTGFCILVIR